MHMLITLTRWALGLGCCLLLVQAAGAADSVLPPVIQAGFTLWPKGGAEVALETWQKGGFLDGDNNKTAALAGYFRQIDRALGNFTSCEPVEQKAIGKRSQIVYLAVNFERGVVFAKFLLYRTEKNWVVQNLYFDTRPEAIMPWLATEGTRNAE